MTRTRAILALPLLALAAACTHTGQPPAVAATEVAPLAGPKRADVNPGYQVGRIAMKGAAVPTLQQMQEMKASPSIAEVLGDSDRLRAPALRDAAMSYGARGGLAYASKQINEMLEARSAELSRTYDFSAFLIKVDGGMTVLPPVIVESRDTYEQADAGKTLRVADTYYEIVEQARFAPVAPLWHTYLMRNYTAPEAPSDQLLPKNDGERDLWRKFVAEGWAQGIRQAQEIFQADLRKLERDFTGMVKYAELLETRQVSAPVVASTDLGTTGSGQDMRVGDRALRIMADPRLNVSRPSEWEAAPSAQTPTEGATPPGGVPGQR